MSKIVHSQKIRCSNAHTFLQKRPFSLKHYPLRSFFSNLPWKTAICHAHMWSKNVNCVKTTLYVPEKSIECLFFICVTKNQQLLCPYCNNNVNLLKYYTLFSCPHFVKKTSTLSKTQCSHVIFFKIFMKNPLLSCAY